MSSIQIPYRELRIPQECSDWEEAAEILLDQIIAQSDIPYSEEEVEQELRMEWAGFLQNMRYRAMGGDHQMEEIDPDLWRSETRREIIRDHQTEAILKAVIQEEKLSVSVEELEEAAVKLAEAQNTTLEMVKRFMGEDYKLIKKEVLYKKAKIFIVEMAKNPYSQVQQPREKLARHLAF